MSFGSSGFGGFGANNNQQQNTGFGFGSTNNNNTTGGFGSTGNTGFGAANTNTGGGLFGSNTNTATSNTGFGASGFGSTNQASTGFGARPSFGTATTSTGSLFGGGTTTSGATGFGGFGASNQANTGSGFGATNQANTGSGFGASTTGGTLFGQNNQSNQTGGFGGTTSGSLFGGQTGASTGFGSSTTTTGGFGQNVAGIGANNAATQNNGTGGTPFQPHPERDNTNQSNMLYQSITCQPPYANFSFEELRMVDYNQGRKYANQSSFGANSTFGGFGSTTQNNTSTFGNNTSGGGGLFGQQSSNNTSTGFGGQQQTGGFGSTGGGLFGQNKPAGTTGLFGSTSSTQGGGPGGGLFTSSGNSGFGQTSGFGNTTSTGGGLFGQQQNTQSKPLFGQSTGTGFGSNNTANTGFGQQANATGGGLFGGTGFGNNQQTNQGSSAFGSFGQNNQNQNQGGTSFGGGFGSTQTQPKSLFGSTQPSGGSGLFGGQNQQPQQGGGLFGSNQQGQQQQQGGGLFGAPKPANQTGGLFGSQPANNASGGGLFGNLNNQNQQNQAGGLFGQNQNQQKPGLFGSTMNNNNTGGGLFGNSGQNNQQQTGGLFGSMNQNQQSQLGSSLFANSQQLQPQPQQPQTLTTSILSATPYGNDHLFAQIGTPVQVGPLATPLSSSQKPRRQPPLPVYRINPAASTRLITPQKNTGYGFYYSTYGTPGSAISNAGSPGYGNSLRGSSLMAKSLSHSQSTSSLRNAYNAEESILNANAFLPGGRTMSPGGSMKKLRINRNLRTDLFGSGEIANDGKGASPLKKTVSFDSDNVRDGRAEETESGSQGVGQTSKALVRVEDNDQTEAEQQGFLRSSRGSINGAKSNGVGSVATSEMEQIRGNELAIVPEESAAPPTPLPKTSVSTEAPQTHQDKVLGEYWLSPSLEQISKRTRRQLSSVENFTVGRHGSGKIEFGTVDLSNVPLDKICGEIVQLNIRLATVYADDANKPPVGKGLNVPSIITLENSWPRAKGGRLHVYEKRGARYEKHIMRLKRVENTEFIKYDDDKGLWVFRVEHFSTYRLDYSDDGDSVASSMLDALPEESPLQQIRPSPIPEEDGSFQSDDLFGLSPGIDDTFEFRRSKSLPGAFDAGIGFDDHDDDLHMADAPADTTREEDVTTSMVEAVSRDSDVFGDLAQEMLALDGNKKAPVKAPKPDLGSPVRPKSILKASQSGRSGLGTPSRGKPAIGQDWIEQLQHSISPKKQDRQALRESQGSMLQPRAQKQLQKAARESGPFRNSIDVMNSLFGQNGNRATSGGSKRGIVTSGFQWPYAKKSKSDMDESKMSEDDKAHHVTFKPRWTDDGTLIYTSADDGVSSSGQTLRDKDVRLSRLVSTDAIGNLPLLEKQREYTKISLLNEVPAAKTSSDFTFEEFSTIASIAGQANLNEKLMWELASNLFDPPVTDENTIAGRGEVKESLSTFWKGLVSHAAMTQIQDCATAEERAVVYLSALFVWEATEALAHGNDILLSTMIAQIGGDEAVREAMKEQIDEWRRSNVLSEMTVPVRTLYELLAGNTCVSEGKTGAGVENKAETFNISARFGFNWRQSFGLKLWYGTNWDEPLTKTILDFAKDVADGREVKRPVPWFVDQGVATGWQDDGNKERQDILWSLLRIYARHEGATEKSTAKLDLAEALSPQTLTGNPLDGRASFQLYNLLRAKEIIDFDTADRDHQADVLTSDFLFQLSSSGGDIRDLIFVALHISDTGARLKAINDLLERHAGVIGDDAAPGTVHHTLVHDFLIPNSWIWAAKALHAKGFLHDDAKAVRCLLRADKMPQAHDTLKKTVAPRAVIEEDLQGLKELLGAFEAAGAAKMDAWELGGGVYAKYVRLLELEAVGPAGRHERETVLRGLGEALKKMVSQGRGLEERVALHEIREAVAAGIAEMDAGGDGRKVLRSKFGQLQVPAADDEVVKAVMKLSDSYYASVTA